MPEKIQIGSIKVITDCDTDLYRIGETQGGFDMALLEQHIKHFGHEELLNTLSYMMHQVWATTQSMNAVRDYGYVANNVRTDK